MKTLGIIGGIAPPSTIEYYRMLFAAYRERRRDGSAPLVIINSIDNQTMLRLIAANALDEVSGYLAAEVEKLARAGADIGLLASNTPHIVFDRLQELSPIPLISIVETAFEVVQRSGLTRVGLLGTKFTMEGHAYPRVFARRGITVVRPDPVDLEYVHEKYMGSWWRECTSRRHVPVCSRWSNGFGIATPSTAWSSAARSCRSFSGTSTTSGSRFSTPGGFTSRQLSSGC